MQTSLFSYAGLLLSAACASAAWGNTFTVGAGRTFATPEHIAWSSVHPGDTIVIYPGTYPSLLGTGNSMSVVGVSGTAAKPITIQGSSAANPPSLPAGILIDSSNYINVRYLNVSRDPVAQPYAAVVVRAKSSNIVLYVLTVHGAFVGISFNDTGLQNRLKSSHIYGNVKNGITPGVPDKSFVPDALHQSYITSNNIHDNGEHGMEVSGPYWRIERNWLTHNGTTVGGTSGIHLFAASDVTGVYTCTHDTIIYNYVTTQQDSIAADGNGIQIDNFCDYNTAEYNVVWSNAGAGISVLAAKGNTIAANTSYSNARDKTRAAKFPGVFRGEIILGSMADLCSNPNVPPASCNVGAGRASGNVIYDNIAVSGQVTVPAIFVSSDAVHRNTNLYFPNLYNNFGAGGTGVELLWDSAPYYTAAAIDQVTGVAAGGAGNLVEAPKFVNTTAPNFGYDGLRLAAMPSNKGRVISPALPDMLGVSADDDDSYYGAYYTAPADD